MPKGGLAGRPGSAGSAALAIAAMEVRRLLGPRAGRTTVSVVALGLLIGLAAPLVADRMPTPEASMHAVAIAPGSPYGPALLADARFRAVEGTLADARAGRVALWAGDRLVAAPDPAGDAALAAARNAVRAWTEAQMELEPQQGAAFPVAVTLQVEPPSAAGATLEPAGLGGALDGDGQEGTDQGGLGGGEATGADGAADGAPLPGADGEDLGADAHAPDPQSSAAARPLRPHEVRLPLPGLGLLLTFLYVLPLNIVAQVASSGFLQERTRRRGLLTLTTPVPRATVLAGRALPTAVLATLLAAVAAVAVGTSWQGAVASIAIIAVPLALAALLGLVARSERELTFLLTAAMTSFALFLFLPAVFRALPAVAYLSPLTVVIEGAGGTTVPLRLMLYATVPSLLGAAGLAWLAWGAYRDEVLHGPLRLGAKLRLALGPLTRTPARAAAAASLLMPLAVVAQVLAVAYVLPFGLLGFVPALAVAFALGEESLKRLLLRACAAARDGSKGLATSAVAIGLGLAVGEKVAWLAQWAGLRDVPGGAVALGLLGQAAAPMMVGYALLHVTTTSLQAWGLRRSRAAARATFGAAVALHAIGALALVVVSLRWAA